MSSNRYVSALIYYKPGSHFSTDNEVFITLVSPMVGILIGITIEVGGPLIVCYIRKKRGKYALNSPKIIPVVTNSNGDNLNMLRRILNRVTTNKIIRLILIVYNHLAVSPVLRTVAITASQLIRFIIISRFGLLIKAACIYAYKKRRQENLFKVVVNTLCWLMASKNRDTRVNLIAAFVITTTSSLWLTGIPIIRNGLLIFTSVTFLNLCNFIYVEQSFLQYRPSDMGVFGLPNVEHLINKPLSSFSEHRPNSKISMIGKEETNVISSPLQNEMPKSIDENFESKMNTIIKDSTLDENPTILPRKVALQKGRISRPHSTSKPKRRVNNLQNLNKADFPDRLKSIENDRKVREKLYKENLEKFPDLLKIKEEKIKEGKVK